MSDLLSQPSVVPSMNTQNTNNKIKSVEVTAPRKKGNSATGGNLFNLMLQPGANAQSEAEGS